MTVEIQTYLGRIFVFYIHGDPTTIGARLKKWKRSFQLFACGKGVTNPAQKKTLIFTVGAHKRKMYSDNLINDLLMLLTGH